MSNPQTDMETQNLQDLFQKRADFLADIDKQIVEARKKRKAASDKKWRERKAEEKAKAREEALKAQEEVRKAIEQARAERLALKNANDKEASDLNKITTQLLDTTILKQETEKKTLVDQQIADLQSQLKELQPQSKELQTEIEKLQDEYARNLTLVERQKETVTYRKLIRDARDAELKEREEHLSTIPVLVAPVFDPSNETGRKRKRDAREFEDDNASDFEDDIDSEFDSDFDGDAKSLLPEIDTIIHNHVMSPALCKKRAARIFKRNPEEVPEGAHNYSFNEKTAEDWKKKGFSIIKVDTPKPPIPSYARFARIIMQRSIFQILQDIEEAKSKWITKEFESKRSKGTDEATFRRFETVEKKVLRLMGENPDLMRKLKTLAASLRENAM